MAGGDRSPVVFLVRASLQDGLGHLVRSLCVLRELVRGVPVHLLMLGDNSGMHLIEESGVPWTQCTSDTEAVTLALQMSPRVVVFDMLSFDAEALDRIASRAAVVSLSPEFSQMTRVHHLFHRTAQEHPAWAKEPRFPRVHKGLQYTVLPAWLKPVSTEVYREHLEEERLGVAISMGGTDAPNVTLSLLERFGQTQLKLVIWVALGDAYTHSYGNLLACAAHNRQEVILLKSNESMWRVVKNASLVLCAGGLTTYEAVFVGLPTINLIRHDGWAYLFEELTARGACFVIPPSPDRTDRAVAMVTELDANRRRLMQCHLATRGVIPGGGAALIARRLQLLHTEGNA
jgi:spore coat polysaccharide biosynthesis predicted glycosyltransferase SpsG